MPSTVRLTHPESPGEVVVHLPMDMGLTGEVLMALGRLGFELPDAKGKSKMRIEVSLGPHEEGDND